MTVMENFPMVQQGLFSTGLELPRKIHFSQISFIPTLQKIILTSKLFSEEKSDYLFKESLPTTPRYTDGRQWLCETIESNKTLIK